MPKFLPILLVASLSLAAPTQAQEHVLGPRSVSEDSIQVTITEVRLKVVNSDDRMSDGLTPTLEPAGGENARIWFALGFMLDSCRVVQKKRIDASQPNTGSTLQNITFRCHYKASEFRSAINDVIQ